MEENKYALQGVFYGVDINNPKEKDLYYLSEIDNLKEGQNVVVETPFGLEFGKINRKKITKEIINSEENIRKVIRVATEEDSTQHKTNLELQQSVKKAVDDAIKNLELQMNVVDIRYTLDQTKVLISYVADERVDFRNLLKDLANILKCRIELRQIGSRDRSAIVGGIGVCGLPLCCSTFLKEFDGISINMAKNQMLSLNISKISGQCGKLLCCLKYEDGQYTIAKQGMPKIGFKLKHKGKMYKIDSINYISEQVKLSNEDNEVEMITVEELRGLKHD